MIGSNEFATYSIMGVMALFASFLTSRLPETIDEPLCETIESAERFLPLVSSAYVLLANYHP